MIIPMFTFVSHVVFGELVIDRGHTARLILKWELKLVEPVVSWPETTARPGKPPIFEISNHPPNEMSNPLLDPETWRIVRALVYGTREITIFFFV